MPYDDNIYFPSLAIGKKFLQGRAIEIAPAVTDINIRLDILPAITLVHKGFKLLLHFAEGCALRASNIDSYVFHKSPPYPTLTLISSSRIFS